MVEIRLPHQDGAGQGGIIGASQMGGRMKVITYWETAPGRTMPPYIALGITTMQLALGDQFLLLTDKNTRDYIGDEYLRKSWAFNKHNKNLTPEIAAIVAKSDFVRMAYIVKHGGFWIDADTIVFKDFLPSVKPADDKLQWHSEQFFGATAGNELLAAAVDQVIADEKQVWGNPGGIKTLIEQRPGAVTPIPFKYLNPGHVPTYGYSNCRMLLEKDMPVDAFLTNKEAKLMKLYNSDFCAADIGTMGLADFFRSQILLSRIFLSVNPEPQFWIGRAMELIAQHE